MCQMFQIKIFQTGESTCSVRYTGKGIVMNQTPDNDLLIKVAQMYYEENLTQQRISQKLNMSRSLVSKLLIKAKKSGIVEIVVHSEPTHPFKEMEDKLQKVLKLKYVRIVDNSESPQKNNVSVEAGIYLASKLPYCRNVIISAGRTTREIARYFVSTTSFSNVTFLPVSGGVGEIQWDIDSNMICAQMAQKCGGRYKQIHAPIIVDSTEAKEILLEQSFIKDILEQSAKADVAVVGIGKGFQKEKMIQTYLMDKEEDYFENEEKIMGDFCYNYFDSEGNIVDCKWNRRLIGLSLEQIRKIPEVVCIAEEPEKGENLYIAAKSRMITSMIIDIKVARVILKAYSRDLFH